MSTVTVGHPGGFYVHIRALALAIREKKWNDAFGYAVELFQMVKEDFENVPPPPLGATMAAPALSAEAVADALDAMCPTSAEGPQPVGAVPWMLLLPLLLKAAEIILSRGTGS